MCRSIRTVDVNTPPRKGGPGRGGARAGRMRVLRTGKRIRRFGLPPGESNRTFTTELERGPDRLPAHSSGTRRAAARPAYLQSPCKDQWRVLPGRVAPAIGDREPTVTGPARGVTSGGGGRGLLRSDSSRSCSFCCRPGPGSRLGCLLRAGTPLFLPHTRPIPTVPSTSSGNQGAF